MASSRKIKRQSIDGESSEYLSPEEQIAEDQRLAMQNAKDADGKIDLSKAIGFSSIVTPDRRSV